jgi:DNA-binding MarR family transcriptional regulator
MKPNIIFTKLNAELFQFLAEPLPYKTSRFDAFRYLYECPTDNFNELVKYTINIPFDTKYKQLAERWGWERKAVMSFLRSLQKMGILEIKRSSRYIHIHIKNLACMESETKVETGDDST